MCGRHCANICMRATSGRKDHKDYDGFCTQLCLFFSSPKRVPSRQSAWLWISPRVWWDIGWPRYHRPGLTQAFKMPLKSRRSGSKCRFFYLFFCTNTEIQTSRWICLSVFLLSYVSCLTSQRRQQTGNSRKQHGGKRQCYRVNFWCLYFSLTFKLTTDWVISKCSLFGIRQQTLYPHVRHAIALETGQKRSVSALFHLLEKLPTCSQMPVVSHELKKKTTHQCKGNISSGSNTFWLPELSPFFCEHGLFIHSACLTGQRTWLTKLQEEWCWHLAVSAEYVICALVCLPVGNRGNDEHCPFTTPRKKKSRLTE